MTDQLSLELPIRERTLGNLIALKAARNGPAPFLSFEDRTYSYADAHRISNKLANGFLSVGIKPGDHVALFLDNRPDILWIHFALAKIGAIAIPINTAAKGELLVYYLTQSDSVCLVLEHATAAAFLAVEAQCPNIRTVVLCEPLDEGYTSPAVHSFGRSPIPFAQIEKGEDCVPNIPVQFLDLAHIFYSSGTTGPSKGCMVAHATLIGIALKYVQAFKYGDSDALYTCLPLFHGNAFNCTVMPALLSNARVALSRRFSAHRFWDEIRSTGATQFTLLSAMTTILWNRPRSESEKAHNARICQIIPTPEFFHAFQERFNIKLVSLYSLSDFGLGAILGPDAPLEKWRSAGKVQPDVSVAILDDDDLPIPANEVGEICMRSNEPWIARQGYYRMAEAYMKACRNQWFHTGDRGYLDADGYLYFVDRKKDVIRRRGENISAFEVEQIIQRHPAVAELAAYPVRSELSEDEVMISVVRAENTSVDEVGLIRFCEDNMAYYMVPRYIEFVELLPKTMTQKIEKFRLRERAEIRLSEIWDRERAGIVVKR